MSQNFINNWETKKREMDSLEKKIAQIQYDISSAEEHEVEGLYKQLEGMRAKLKNIHLPHFAEQCRQALSFWNRSFNLSNLHHAKLVC